MRIVIPCILALLSVPMAVFGAEQAQAARWNAQGTFSLLPAANLHGTSSDAGITDYRVRLSQTLTIDKRLSLTIGGGYGLKHIDAPAAADLPPDLHALFLDAGAHYHIDDRSFATLKLMPGFYSDFGDIGSEDLRMPLIALGGYRFESGVTLVGGFVYRAGYHAASFIPVLGLSYQPNEQWKIDLMLPRPGITYSPSRTLKCFLAGDFASDEYELHGRSRGVRALRYSDLKAMAGIEYQAANELRLTAATGYAFERRFSFYDGTRGDLRLDDAPFMRLTVDIGW